MFFSLPPASAALSRLRFMRARSAAFREGVTMFEALIGLAVAVALAAYLVVTLVRPERF
ncbi:K(+)-transporting ATPase subunit F [Sinorhizobium chiapasense]